MKAQLEADKRGSGTAQSDEAAVADLKVGRRVLDVEARAIATLAGQLDGGFADAVARLAEVEGRVIVTGMGKSGHVARKIAATLASTGTPALFVHPGERSEERRGGKECVSTCRSRGSP